MANLLFYVMAAATTVAALGVVLAKNPIASILSLLAAFFGLATIYLLAGFQFIAAAQILVYAGAIMVLFLFVIMLLNLGHDYEDDIRGTGWKIAAGGAGLIIIALLGRVFSGDLPRPLGDEAGPAMLAAAQARDGVVGVIGMPLYNQYVVPLQATAILLLVAVVGAVVLAKRKV